MSVVCIVECGGTFLLFFTLVSLSFGRSRLLSFPCPFSLGLGGFHRCGCPSAHHSNLCKQHGLADACYPMHVTFELANHAELNEVNLLQAVGVGWSTLEYVIMWLL